MGSLSDKRLFLLDMDGTIYLDDDLFDGTVDFLDHVKAIGGKYLFLTNNSSRSVEAYMEKLGRMGIETREEDFLTSVNATAAALKIKSESGAWAATASNMSFAETMSTTRTKGGFSTLVGPETRVTSAPRSMAIFAMA